MTKTRHKHRYSPKGQPQHQSDNTWDEAECRDVIARLWALRTAMQANESRLAVWLRGADATWQASARNLAHYLALRQDDQRALQAWLTHAGVSSLGRAESHAMANLDKVLGILHRLSGQPWAPHDRDEAIGIRSSHKLLERHTAELLGPAPDDRAVRIMVTLPSEAASDFALVRQLVASGMDIARINCAHDGADEWKAMASRVRRAARAAGRPVRILMDLGGPKLRTGTLAQGPALLKLRPERDEFGRILEPALVGLRAAGATMPVAGAPLHVGVDADWLVPLEAGDRIAFTDARGASRRLEVLRKDETGALCAIEQTAYLAADTALRHGHKGHAPRHTTLAGLPQREGVLHLARGSTLRLTRADTPAAEAKPPAAKARSSEPLTVACTLPEVFAQVSAGERIWFDDGRIGGVIKRVQREWIEVEITHARDSGEKLTGDKGINLPDSALRLPALTDKDLADLAVAAKVADMVGLSFVQQAADVRALRARLRDLGKPALGIVLKIETRRAFENLPELLFAAMAGPSAGIMIARGDLAVECGYERLAEVQEEILWAAEAAHMPVIWATQVLETLAKTGLPSRAEITDAAMGERAECVMLNKGPHIAEAMRTLDDILRRMQAHQSKKRPLLRALKSWQPGADQASGNDTPSLQKP